MAELVDALVSGTSGSNALEVRVFLSAPVLGFPMGGFLFFAHVGAWLSSLRVRIDELQQR